MPRVFWALLNKPSTLQNERNYGFDLQFHPTNPVHYALKICAAHWWGRWAFAPKANSIAPSEKGDNNGILKFESYFIGFCVSLGLECLIWLCHGAIKRANAFPSTVTQIIKGGRTFVCLPECHFLLWSWWWRPPTTTSTAAGSSGQASSGIGWRRLLRHCCFWTFFERSNNEWMRRMLILCECK